MKNKVLLLALFIVLLSATAFGYTSDRMDFGDVDFGGATVTYVAWWNPLEEFEEGGDYAGRLDEAMEKFNIGGFEFLQLSWGEELQENMFSRFMAGDSDYDFWMLPHPNFLPLRTAGAILPVNEFLSDDYYANMPHQHQLMGDALGLGPNKYTFSVFNGIHNNVQLMAFNKDLIEREGLPDPYELYENGEWTWDTLTDLAERVTRDTNNDGEVDQWGLAHIDNNFDTIIFSNNGRITEEVDGAIKYVADMPETVEALRQIREWNQELGVTGGTWQKEVFFDGQAAFAMMPTWEVGQLRDGLEAEYGLLPIPMGPSATEYVYSSDNVDSLYLPANAAQPEAMLALDNFLFRVDEFYEAQDETFVERATDFVSYQVLYESVENWSGLANYYEGIIGPSWDGVWGGAYQDIMSGESSAAGAVAEIAPVAQSLLDDALDQ
ncbi:ABC transporter substrate-binding protein [Natronospora cellulosivora (SeqCode)]